MKKYRLKQWYPSLDEEWHTTHRYEYQSSTGYMCNKSMQHCVIIYKKELHSDFWELIEEEKPLKFITEDGVSIYGDMKTYAVAKGDLDIDNPEIYGGNSASLKYFYHKENALAYIEKNKEKKPLFITEDGVEIFEGDEYIAIGINYDFRKVDTVAHDQVYSGDVMRFKYESNADEYIVKNKPVFSYEDFIRWGNVPYERVIMQLAKKRI